MPYQTIAGGHEVASRLSHSTATVKAISDTRSFYVPAEALHDVEAIRKSIRPRSDFARDNSAGIDAALAIDGSYMVEPIRDGLPSVQYGFAQAAAAFVDLGVMETQRAERFIDPSEIERAVATALVTLDLPAAGAYTRQGIDILTSWREAIDGVFRAKFVEVNRLNQPLLDLLFLLHGRPGAPAQTVPTGCPADGCDTDLEVPRAGMDCWNCSIRVYPTDALRIHEEVSEDGTNQIALSRLMSVVELLVLVGLATLLWNESRNEVFSKTLFIVDGPLAMHGPPAKLRARALSYFQAMAAETLGLAPYICGIEKSGLMVDYARQLARHDVLKPGDLLVCDGPVIERVANTKDVKRYGKETYWGRKFVYRALDGRVVVPTVMPPVGAPYDSHGGMPEPDRYPTLAAILDVIDRTGSSMYVDGIIPVAAAHGKAAFPIGVGTDVLRLVAKTRLGLDTPPPRPDVTWGP